LETCQVWGGKKPDRFWKPVRFGQLWEKFMFEEYAVTILIFSAIFMLFTYFLNGINYNYIYSNLILLFIYLILFVQIILTFLLLISGEIILVDWLAETDYVSQVKKGFISLWWLTPVYFFGLAAPNDKFRISTWIWFGKVILTLVLFNSGEFVLINWLAETGYVSYVTRGFDILWWFVIAYLIDIAIKAFLFARLEEPKGDIILENYRRFITTIVYSLAIVGIIIFVYELTIIGTIIFALLVIVIKKFSTPKVSTSLFIEHVLRIGEWVKIGQFEEGKVIGITWRTIRIKTRDDCIISIPNQIVSQATVKNFCKPDDTYWLTTTVKVHAMHSPTRVEKILLDAALSSNKIFKELAPVVLVTDIGNGTVEYVVAYCSDDYANKTFIKEDIIEHIRNHLKWANIELLEPTASMS
jgi:branched-chain amino acid transport system substrate-binding protein